MTSLTSSAAGIVTEGRDCEMPAQTPSDELGQGWANFLTCVWETVSPCQQPLKLNVTKYNISPLITEKSPSPFYERQPNVCACMAASKHFTVVAARTASHWRMKRESSGAEMCALVNDSFLFHMIGLFVQSETVIIPSQRRELLVSPQASC